MNIQEIFHKLHHRTPSVMGHEHFKKSSVIIPLVDKEGETHILFEVRSMQMRSQPGDICFPGGRVDPSDKSPSDCAVRETMEELGLSEQDITDPIPLDYIVNDLGRIIYPFVGRVISPDKIDPNPAEVDHTFTVPLSFFMETEPDRYKVHLQIKPEDNFPYHLIVGGENYDWRMRHIEELFYQYNGKTIWGLTAKILTHFIELIDTEGERS